MKVWYHGHARYCPVCENFSRKFRHFGLVPREDAQCILCGALERHRFLWVYLQRRTNLFDEMPRNVLHVAAEQCYEQIFKKLFGQGYLTADLLNPRAMIKMDITNIQYADQSFDVIFCNHVLEHIQDDNQAIAEIFRVLKNDGWAILLVPLTSTKTFEDPTITNPAYRREAFGQKDHVRRYGPDYVDRLRKAGFQVEITEVIDLLNDNEIIQLGLSQTKEDIYYCTKKITNPGF